MESVFFSVLEAISRLVSYIWRFSISEGYYFFQEYAGELRIFCIKKKCNSTIEGYTQAFGRAHVITKLLLLT